MQIRISPGNKFRLELDILMFWTKLSTKGISCQKQEINLGAKCKRKLT